MSKNRKLSITPTSAEEAVQLCREEPQEVLAMISYCLSSFTLSPEDTDDLISSIYLHLISKALYAYNGSSQLHTFIGVVTKQCARNFIRKLNKDKSRHHSYSPDIDIIGDVNDVNTQISELMCDESPLVQNIIYQKYWNECSNAQIAEITGVPLKSIEPIIQAFIERVKESCNEFRI